MSAWNKSHLNEIAAVIDCKHRTPEYSDDGYPIVSPGNISWGPLRFDGCRRISYEDYQALMDHCEVQIWDLILSRNQTFGVASYVETDEPFALGQDTVLVQAKDCVAQFLYYMIQSFYVQDQIISLSGGSTFKRINLADIRKLSILLPSLPEQRKIAAILSTWDEAIALTEQLIGALQRRKQALMQMLLTGAVRFGEFEGSEWEETTLGDISSKMESGGTPSTQNAEYWMGSIPWITGADFGELTISQIRRYITEEAVSHSSTKIVEKGDVLLVSRTGVGKMALAPFDIAISQDITGIKPKQDVIKASYLLYYLAQTIPEIIKFNQGTSINGITREDLRQHAVIVPSIEEQSSITDVLESSDEEIRTVGVLLNRLHEQKRGLMQQLLTGAVRVAVNGE